MSDLSKPRECAEWIRDWETQSPATAWRWIARAAVEQRRNLDSLVSVRPDDRAVKPYARSVAMLERAALRAHRRLLHLENASRAKVQP